jgi:hypothetical protein
MQMQAPQAATEHCGRRTDARRSGRCTQILNAAAEFSYRTFYWQAHETEHFRYRGFTPDAVDPIATHSLPCSKWYKWNCNALKNRATMPWERPRCLHSIRSRCGPVLKASVSLALTLGRTQAPSCKQLSESIKTVESIILRSPGDHPAGSVGNIGSYSVGRKCDGGCRSVLSEDD